MLGRRRPVSGDSMPRLAVLIVAAGRGERAGLGVPKQYEKLAGKPMLRRTVEAFWGQNCSIHVVIGQGQTELAAQALSGLDLPGPITGGSTRQESVRLGLEALKSKAPDFVLVYGAGRAVVLRR